MPNPNEPTRTFIWCLVIFCIILAVLIILTGIVVFIGYEIIHPKNPKLTVKSAHLDYIYFDQASQLSVRVIIVLKAENANKKAFASFYETRFELYLQGVKVAILVAYPFNVERNSTKDLHYVIESNSIELSPEDSEDVEMNLDDNLLGFYLRGHIRTRWRVGPFGSVKFWLRLDCRLNLPVDKTIIRPNCFAKAR